MRFFLILLAPGLLAACSQGDTPIMSSIDPAQLQPMQTRVYANADRGQALRDVIASFEDNGYSIDRVEAQTGTVSATKNTNLVVTAEVQPGPGTTTSVRADALVRVPNGQRYEVDDPQFYTQDVFYPLSRSLAIAPPQAAAAAPPPDAQTPSDAPWHATPSP